MVPPTEPEADHHRCFLPAGGPPCLPQSVTYQIFAPFNLSLLAPTLLTTPISAAAGPPQL